MSLSQFFTPVLLQQPWHCQFSRTGLWAKLKEQPLCPSEGQKQWRHVFEKTGDSRREIASPSHYSWCQEKVISLDHTLWRSRKVTLSKKKAIVQVAQVGPKATFRWSILLSRVACGPFADKVRGGFCALRQLYKPFIKRSLFFSGTVGDPILLLKQHPFFSRNEISWLWQNCWLYQVLLAPSCNYADQSAKIRSSWELL